MEKKHVPAALYYCAEKTTTFDDIPGFAEGLMKRLYQDLKTAAIEITGPPEFQYFNVDPTGTKPFTLIIAIPVKEKKTAGAFFFMEADPFTCLTKDYHGPIQGIGDAWMALVDEALDEGYLLQNQCREIYRQWVDTDSEKNLTELQVGVAAKKS